MSKCIDRWIEVTESSAVEINPPKNPGSPTSFMPRKGSPETKFTCFVATWPRNWPRIILPDASITWMGISGNAEADLRGYAKSDNGSVYKVAAEVKAVQRNRKNRSISYTQLSEALNQCVKGLKKMAHRFNKDDEVWYNIKSSSGKAMLVVICDGCNLFDTQMQNKRKKKLIKLMRITESKAKRLFKAKAQIAIVEIQRYLHNRQRYVKTRCFCEQQIMSILVNKQ